MSLMRKRRLERLDNRHPFSRLPSHPPTLEAEWSLANFERRVLPSREPTLFRIGAERLRRVV
jgi:hypothetical protein